jgi:hypothetical protein
MAGKADGAVNFGDAAILQGFAAKLAGQAHASFA